MKVFTRPWLARLFTAAAVGFCFGCAVPGKGILLSVEPASPLDQRDLLSYCDLGDKAACALAQSEKSTRHLAPFAIVQGVATPDRAVFSAVVPKDLPLSWFIYDRDVGRLWKLFDSRRQMRPTGAWYVQRIEARELLAGRTYELLAGDKEGNLLEERSFRTLSPETALRFVAVSGTKNMAGPSAHSLLSAAMAKSPQIILFTGDNLDVSMSKTKLPAKRASALDFFFERHVAARNSFAFARERNLVPVAATWSEAEFGLPNGDRSFIFKDEAREVFEMFFPFWADESTILNGPGVAKAIQFGRHTLTLLDDRSFRAPPAFSPPCDPSAKKKKKAAACSVSPPPPLTLLDRLGSMQRNWAFRQSSQPEQIVWLVSADPWLGLYQLKGEPPANSTDWLAQISGRASLLPISAAGTFALLEATEGAKANLSIVDSSGTILSKREISAQ